MSAASDVVVPTPTLRWVWSVVVALLRHPALWPTAVAQIGRMAARGWWRRPPFLPLPSGPYLAFRSQTMYGDAARLPEPHDVVVYLQWCRRFPRRADAAVHPAGGAAPGEARV